MKPGVKPVSAEIRFWSKVKKTESCWLYVSSQKRYPRISISYQPHVRVMAHRFSYELHYGPIPPGLLVLHKCDNIKCVNPKHLFLGTNKDNTQDMIRKGRRWDNGGENHYNHKLSLEEAGEIKKSNLGTVELANKYQISPAQVCNIRKGKYWKNA